MTLHCLPCPQGSSQLSQESSYGKKNTKQVDGREYDKDQQHRSHCHQGDGKSESLDHRSILFALKSYTNCIENVLVLVGSSPTKGSKRRTDAECGTAPSPFALFVDNHSDDTQTTTGATSKVVIAGGRKPKSNSLDPFYQRKTTPLRPVANCQVPLWRTFFSKYLAKPGAE